MNTSGKRRYPRLEFGIRIFQEKDWMIRDLSPFGCYIETANPLPVGSRITLRFEIPLEDQYYPVAASALVRRSEAEGMGLEFLDLDAEARLALEKFVDIYY